MATQRRKIQTGEVYHIVNRGIDSKDIFLNKNDYLRFIHDMYEFNNEDTVSSVLYYFNKYSDPAGHNIIERKPRKLLVEILSFCLMPNHYHLLLRSFINGGVIKFLSKLGSGYAKYFNIKYKRAGPLYQSRFKSIPVINESHFIHIPYYIHCNPLDLITPEWREKKISNPKKAIEFLNSYRWSSHLDFCGKHNFPSVTNRNFLLEVFGSEKKYQQKINEWIKDMEINNFKESILE